MKFLNYKLVAILLVFLASCTHNITPEELQQLNGYWNISSVTINGTTKALPATINTDYFFLDQNLKGFRKKLTPRFDGKFQKNNDQETLSVIFVEQEPYLVYQTKFNTWKEKIVSLTASEVKLMNQDGKIYHYKRLNTKK